MPGHKLRALFLRRGWGLRFAFLARPADLARGMRRAATPILEGSRDEDHLAFVSFTFSPVVDAFFAKGPRVIALEVVPRRWLAWRETECVPLLGFLARDPTRCYSLPVVIGLSHIPLANLTLTLLRLQVSHPLYFPGTPTMLISSRS